MLKQTFLFWRNGHGYVRSKIRGSGGSRQRMTGTTTYDFTAERVVVWLVGCWEVKMDGEKRHCRWPKASVCILEGRRINTEQAFSENILYLTD